MELEINAKYIHKESTLLLINKENERVYKIEGKEANVCMRILKDLYYMDSIGQIAKKNRLSEENVSYVISEFISLGLLKKRNKSNILLVGEEDERSYQILRGLTDITQDLFNMEIKVGGIDCNIDKYPLIVYISNKIDYEKSKKIDKISILNNKNLMLVTVEENNFMIGPLFSPEGGPCVDCFYKSYVSNLQSQYHEFLLYSPKVISLIIFNECIRYFKKNTHVNIFNQVINIDFNTLSIKKQRIFKQPNCQQCEIKKELI